MSPDKAKELSMLERGARKKASALAFDEELAVMSYAIVSLERGSLQGALWLGRSLATLGDAAATNEVFRHAASLARTREDGEGVARAYVRAKRLLREAKSSKSILRALRDDGRAAVQRGIALSRRLSRPERRCPKCDGWGRLDWF